MVICDSCNEKNTLNGRFCRACGKELGADALAAARAANAEAVAEGQRLFGNDRTAEARVLAQSVVDSDPGDVAGLALLGDCLEREGLYGEALHCYEVVVGLNPDSALDRIRLSQLRKKVEAPVRNRARLGKDRALTVLSAVAAAVLLFSVGTAFVLATRPKTTKTASTSEGATLGERLPFTGPSPLPHGNGQVAPPETENAGTHNPVVANQERADGAAGTADQGTVIRRDSRPVNASGVVRNPVTVARGEIGGSFRPVDPFTVTPERLPNANTTKVEPVNPDEPKPVNAGTTPTSGNTRRAVVDIRPAKGSGTNVGGSSTIEQDRANEAETLLRVGRQHQMSGDNNQASAAYERALRAGADPATTNQRLAQVYEKQGRKGEAAAAYRKAGEAFERKLQEGKGDRKLIEAQVESCKQAAKLLGG